MNYKTKKATLFVSSLAGLLLVQGVIWIPEVAHYHVSRTSLSNTVVDQAILERDSGFTEAIHSIDFGLAGDLSDIETVLFADNMLNGILDFPGFGPRKLHWPFEKYHLLLGGPSFQLKMAGLAWVELALDAWRLTGDNKYLSFAEENVLRFIRFEDRRILPTGYLWNDHALANRAVVYAQLWAALNTHGPIERETASILLTAVDRTASLLAKPSHYTFRTNHGVMQNAALIVAAAAFPWLDTAEAYRRTGFERLTRQMDYFISNQGAVLEHSAGYHEFGVSLLRSCFELLGDLAVPVPIEWQSKLQRSEELLHVLSRPDYSIPNFGDSQPSLSKAGREMVHDLVHKDRLANNINSQVGKNGSFLMDAGYAIFRAGIGKVSDSGVHAAITWSHFISGAHKHADELSISYWVNGTTLWSSSGYWPYGAPYRDLAVGWAGSNAPHFVGEKAESVRSSSLVAAGDGGDYSVWVLRRRNEDGYDVSRQVILFRDEWALVVDAVQDQKSRPTEIIWGAPPNVAMNSRGERSARLVDHGSGQVLEVSVDATALLDLSFLRGSIEPFGGWMASEGEVKPSSAIRILSEANSAVVIAWGKLSGLWPTSGVDVKIADWAGETHWTIDLQVDGSKQTIQRVGSRLVLSDSALTARELRLVEPDVDQSLSAEADAYRKEASRAEVYPDYFPWRLKVSQYCLYLFLGLVLLIALLPGKFTAALFPYALSAISAGALLLGIYLQFVYFVP